MKEVLLFFICYGIILTIYELFIVFPMKRYKAGKSRKKEKKEPAEIKYLVYRYRLDLKKVDYNKLLHIVSLVSSFDMAIIVSFIMLVDGYLWQMLLAIVLVIPIVLVSYALVARFYKKKGMIKNV